MGASGSPLTTLTRNTMDTQYIDAFTQQVDLMQYYAQVRTGPLFTPQGGGQPAARYLARLLETAQPIFVAHNIAASLAAATPTFPDDITIEPEDFPTQRGFLWLGGYEWEIDRPKIKSHPFRTRIRAITYNVLDGGVEICLYGYNVDSRAQASPTQICDMCDWRFAEDITSDDRAVAWVYKDELDKPDALVEVMLFEESGLRKVQVPLQEFLENHRARTRDFRKMVYSLVHFMNQKLVRNERYALPRQIRRHMPPAWKAEPVVQVVEFRQRETGEHQFTEGPAPEWSTRWVVRGHWRRIEDKDGRARAVWVNAHIKGPDGLPLKNPQKLFAVVK